MNPQTPQNNRDTGSNANSQPNSTRRAMIRRIVIGTPAILAATGQSAYAWHHHHNNDAPTASTNPSTYTMP